MKKNVDIVVVAQGLTKVKFIVMSIGVYKILVVKNLCHHAPTVLNTLMVVSLPLIAVKGLVKIASIVLIIVGNVIHVGQRYQGVRMVDIVFIIKKNAIIISLNLMMIKSVIKK